MTTTKAPRCATCGHGADAREHDPRSRWYDGHAFVPPADAKPAEAEWCERCGRERDAHNGRHLCSTFVEPAPRAKPAFEGEPQEDWRRPWFSEAWNAMRAREAEPAPRAQPAEVERWQALFDDYDRGTWMVARGSGDDVDVILSGTNEMSAREVARALNAHPTPIPRRAPVKPPVPAALTWIDEGDGYHHAHQHGDGCVATDEVADVVQGDNSTRIGLVLSRMPLDRARRLAERLYAAALREER